ncbi:MAG: MarR family transcriptional regulator [Chitinophagales bacterium]|nr:MarR family transcriptional regulator [Chitinophagales bacterium]
MRLEEEIKQPFFRNELQKANVNVIYTYYWLWDRIKAELKPYGITPQQFNVLRILRGQNGKPISTSDIRERMLDRMSDVSRIVERLHKQQLVIRKTCKSDKRLVDVLISQKGINLLSEIDGRQEFIDKSLSLSLDEAASLNQLLDKARGNEPNQ